MHSDAPLGITIGIDLMGSDRSPQLLFEAIQQAACELPATATLIAIATPELISSLQTSFSSSFSSSNLAASSSAKIEFAPAEEIVTMEESPLAAIRSKKRSSLAVGISLLKKRSINAFISAGNTGALIGFARLLLPMLPGIQRPALLAVIPTITGSVAVLDVGANVSCKASQLVEFAQLGITYQRHMQNIPNPSAGLLNIGVEAGKGTVELREAYQILEQQRLEGKINFIGNVEGREVFQGKVDVLVTDGFTGNVFLKTSEGVSAFVFEWLKGALTSDSSKEIKKETEKETGEILSTLKKRFDYTEYPGAILCGVEGIVIKCHGNAGSKAIINGIKRAFRLASHQPL